MKTTRLFQLAAAGLVMLMVASPAFAVNKDMVQLQTQIQQLQDAVARLQQSNDERMGVLKDLVQQSADSVNRMSVTMTSLEKQLAAQSAANGAKTDQISGQVQALNDSLDEIRARMARLEKALGEVEGQTQSIGAAIQNLPQSTGAPVVGSAPVQQAPAPVQQASVADAPAAPVVRKPAAGVPARAVASAPVGEMYKAAYNDYIAAKYAVSASEFGDLIKSYPEDALAGNAFYYEGEIEYRAGHYAAAAKDYDRVLEQFPDSNKIPVAHLHKGQALIELKQQDAGVRELRTLIQRFPSSPEATQARSKLSGMGVPVKPRP